MDFMQRLPMYITVGLIILGLLSFLSLFLFRG